MRAFLLIGFCAVFMATAAWAQAAEGPQAGPARNPPSTPVSADAITLIMVDDPACHYCRRWHQEVGGGYARTAEGRAAPLTRVPRNAKALLDFAPVIYTPTFILVRDGRELGRITGYPGQLYFWEELSQMMASAGIKTKG